MPARRLPVLFVVLACALPRSGMAAEPALCLQCHANAGTAAPDLAGMPKAAFVAAVEAFRSGAREHPVMRCFALSLPDCDVARLAEYFSGLKAANDGTKAVPGAR